MLKQLSEPEIRLEMEASLPDLLPQTKLDEYCITREQEQNLRILVVGLERMLPTHEDKFSMLFYAGFGENSEMKARIATIEHPCNTPACAVGYGPSCGIAFSRDDGDFRNYSVRCFGGENPNCSETINDFMFSGGWHIDEPNVVKPVSEMREAIARIKIVLAGEVPEKFNYHETYA